MQEEPKHIDTAAMKGVHKMTCRIINLVSRRLRKLPIFRWWWVDLLEIDIIIIIIDNQNDWKYVCAITGKGKDEYNSEYSCIRIERLIVIIDGPLKAVVAAIDRKARSTHPSSIRFEESGC